jgi:tetrathionate reductase subunit B
VNPEIGRVDKCDFCSPRLDAGLQPACVETCPSKAKIFGNLEDRSSDVYRLVYHEGASRSESSTVRIGPNVYYTGKEEKLELALSSFVPGEPKTVPAAWVWTALAKKFVYLAVGATFLGQAAAFFHQLATGEKQFEE